MTNARLGHDAKATKPIQDTKLTSMPKAREGERERENERDLLIT